MLVHVVGIAVIGGEDHDAPLLLDGQPEAAELEVHAFHPRDDCLVNAG
jgi:hypothetical protein